jgi:signal transduction histidine kinase
MDSKIFNRWGSSIKRIFLSRIVIFYLIFAVLWVLVSDQLIWVFASSWENLHLVQSLKELVFVLVTAGLFYALLQSETKRHERSREALRRVNRALRALSESNKVIFQAENEQQMLEEICQIIVEVAGYRLAWVSIKEMDEAKSVRPVVSAGCDEGYVKMSNATWADSERGRGPTGTALRTGKPVAFRDVLADPYYRPWQEAARKRGYASSLALPLKIEGETFAALTVCSAEKNDFDEEEVSLLSSLAADLAFGISVLRTRDERRRMEESKAKLESQLAQAQKMEAVGNLAGGIAHDFNNILAVVSYNAEILSDDIPENQEGLRNIGQILKAVGRAKDLIRQILTFSRSRPASQAPLLLRSVVKEALKFLRAALPATVEIRENISSEELYILGDPTQVHQLLMNLGTNAAYAMRDSGGILEVTLQKMQLSVQQCAMLQLQEAGDYVLLSVSDTGHGIPQEDLEHIFEPYYTTKKQGEGTGLGLSVVHGIVRSHQGAITVNTQVGKGTCFKVYFPLQEQEARQPVIRTSGSLTGGQERVLLVDDEECVVDATRQILLRLGYKVSAYRDSKEAFAAFSKKPENFDILVTDQTMPRMTGFQLIEKCRRLRPSLPVVLCTGYGESSRKSEEGPFQDVLVLLKPTDRKELAGAVRKVLSSSGIPDAEA